MTERAVRRRLLISGALLFALVAVAWSGTLAGEGIQTGPSWTGLRGVVALALMSLWFLYFQSDRLRPSRSSSQLLSGTLILALFVVVGPALLSLFGEALPASELAMVGSITAGFYLVTGSADRGQRSALQRGARTRQAVPLLVVVLLWAMAATLPLGAAVALVIDVFTGLLWSAVGIYIVTGGFRRDDEVVSTLGIACLALGAGQLLTLAGFRPTAAEIMTLAAVALAVASAYLELVGLVNDQRSELDETREAMRDLAHEARTAITAIEGTLFGLDSRSDLAAEDRESLKAALRIELQSLRLLLSQDRAQPVSEIRLVSVLDAVVSAAQLSGGSVRWLAPPDLEVMFSDGALIEIVQALIDNARTHSGVSEVEVEVAEVGERAEVGIIDRGRGVPDSMKESLFERGVKRWGSPGRGLGLDIARRLAVSHGGQLEYRDNPGGGARFVLSMPLSRRAIDLSLYEEEQFVEIPDADRPPPQAASPDGHRRDPGLAGEAHRHRGSDASGEVAGV